MAAFMVARRGLALRIAAPTLLILGLCLPATTSASVPATRLVVPSQLALDVSNAITLHLPDAVAAVEGRVFVAYGAADLVGVAPSGPGHALTPTAVPGGFAFGAYGMRPKTSRNDLRLVFVPHAQGQLEVHVVIDAAATYGGVRLALGSSDLTSRVQVGTGSGLHAAPLGWANGSPVHTAGALRALFGRSTVSQDDVDVARAAWYSTRDPGAACSTAGNPAGDANGDGCVDIVDLQALSTHIGGVAQGAWGAAASQPTGSTAANTAALPAVIRTAQLANLTFVVTSTADTPDAHNGDGICADASGQCTLRAALTESNWSGGTNTVDFNLPGTAPVLIQLGSSPMSLVGSASSSVVIDGYSQPGSRPNTAQYGTNAVPGVQVRGNGNSSSSYVLYTARPNNTIRGLLLSNAYSGVFIDGPNAANNRIVGDWMGFNADNSLAQRGHAGVWLNNGAHANIVGTPDPGDRNVIGNYDKAIYSYGAGTDGTIIQNNDVCIAPNGLGASCSTGIDFDFGPKASLIGGSDPGDLNVIGPTILNGIEFSHGWDPASNHNSSLTWQINDHRVIGNWVGFRADGNYDPSFRSALAAPSADNGQALHIHDGCNYNLLEGNYVAAAYDGVTIAMSNATGNIVHANIIGQSPLGQPAPLARYGIYLTLNTRVNTVEANEIHNAAAGGIELIDPNVKQIRISRNLVTGTNGPAIYLAPDPNNPATGANDLLPAPVIDAANETVVAGTGLADATVEIFQASRSPGQFGLPIEYLGSTTVTSDGHWSIPLTLVQGQRVTATQIAVNGDTSALAANVNVGSLPPPPIADFTWSQRSDALTVSFTDASTGAPNAWTWDFGDGTSSNEQNPTKAYAQAGDYTVTLTATNGNGGDNQSHVVTVSQIGVGTILAADAFGRSISAGWGTADNGGTYSLDGNAANFSVNNGSGRVVLASNGPNRGALLNDVNARDVDARVRVTVDKPAAGSAYYAYLLLRRNGGNAYRPKLIFNTNGTISIHVGLLLNNVETSIAPSIVVPGLAQSGYIWLRAQIVGSNPTTINVKAWADGQPEPAAWQYTATDSHAAVQGAGGAGLRAYVAGGATNLPLSYRFDDLSITAAAPPSPGAVAADAFGRTISSGWGNADTGGKYTLQGPAANFNVAGGAGTVVVAAANQSRAALLDATSGADVDVSFRVAADKPAVGGNYIVYAVARRNGTSEYRARLIFNSNGTVSVNASVLVNNVETSLGTPVVVPGVTQSANGFVWIRAQITGANPTTINVRAWADGQPEPTGWQFTATDSQSALQGAGSVGMRLYISAAVTTAPVTFSFDDYAVTAAAP